MIALGPERERREEEALNTSQDSKKEKKNKRHTHHMTQSRVLETGPQAKGHVMLLVESGPTIMLAVKSKANEPANAGYTATHNESVVLAPTRAVLIGARGNVSKGLGTSDIRFVFALEVSTTPAEELTSKNKPGTVVIER